MVLLHEPSPCAQLIQSTSSRIRTWTLRTLCSPRSCWHNLFHQQWPDPRWLQPYLSRRRQQYVGIYVLCCARNMCDCAYRRGHMLGIPEEVGHDDVITRITAFQSTVHGEIAVLFGARFLEAPRVKVSHVVVDR